MGCAAVRAVVPDLRWGWVGTSLVANGENSPSEGWGITADPGLALLSVVGFLALGDRAFEAEGAEECLNWKPRVVTPREPGRRPARTRVGRRRSRRRATRGG
jgi:hypothetical protein